MYIVEILSLPIQSATAAVGTRLDHVVLSDAD